MTAQGGVGLTKCELNAIELRDRIGAGIVYQIGTGGLFVMQN